MPTGTDGQDGEPWHEREAGWSRRTTHRRNRHQAKGCITVERFDDIAHRGLKD